MDDHFINARNASHPLVSVIVPAYNVAKYIEATLKSLSDQTLVDFEVIVVDDASTDDTVSVIERWHDPRLRLLKHAVNEGVAAARNTAFDHARGQYIALLDPDDVAFPQRLERQVQAMKEDPTLGMVGASDAVMDESGVSTDEVWRHPVDPIEANVGMFFENTFSTSTLMIRAAALAGQRYRPMRISEDYDLNARIARAWKVCNLDEPLVWRRRRGDGLTATRPAQMLEFNRQIIREHLATIGIEPSDREVELCLFLGKQHLKSSHRVLEEIGGLLTRLCNANDACQRHEESAFKRIMAQRWFEICKFSSDLGPTVLRLYIEAPVAAHLRLSVADWSRLAAKCLFRQRPRSLQHLTQH